MVRVDVALSRTVLSAHDPKVEFPNFRTLHGYIYTTIVELNHFIFRVFHQEIYQVIRQLVFISENFKFNTLY
jgi:membrane-anchored protein YejM (alkaline phosphatase superfamily)